MSSGSPVSQRTPAGIPAGLPAHFRERARARVEETSEAEREEWDFNPFHFVPSLMKTYGWQMLVALVFTEWASKGFAYNLHSAGIDFILKKYSTSAPDIQIFKSFIQLPWGLKPLFGMLSDQLPLVGYRKLPYMTLVTMLGVGGCITVGFTGIPQTPVTMVVVGLFFVCLSVSVNDLLSEARYAEVLQEMPKDGPGIVSFVWMGVFGCGMCGTLLQGTIIENAGPQALYVVAAVPIFLVLVPLATNWIGDKPLSDANLAAAREKAMRERELVWLVVILVAGCVTIGVVTLSGFPKYVNAIVAVTVSTTVITSFYFFTTPIIGKVNAFTVLQGTLAVSIDGAVFYFFTDDHDTYPDGPNFSVKFYTTGLGLIVDFCNLIGIWTYSKYMSKWSYRSLFMFTNLILAGAHLWGVLIYSRYNRELGIPDKTFALTSSAMNAITQMWLWMPAMLLTAQLCPKGSEATMFALIAGCSNLGNNCASMIGAYILELFAVTPTGEPQDAGKFGNLWKVALLSSLLPMLTIAMIPYCIPDALQSEKVLDARLISATTNSPFRQLTMGAEAAAHPEADETTLLGLEAQEPRDAS